VRNNKTSGELECRQNDGRPSTGVPELLETEASITEITNKCPEAASVLRGYRELSYTKILAGSTPTKVGESSEWTIVNSAEENRANICKAPNGKPLFSALFGMHMVTMNKRKASPSSEKPIKAVIRHPHPGTPTEDISNSFEGLGFKVINLR
jgi:hypothetical protein